MDAKNSVRNVERTSSKLVHFVSIVLIRDFEKIQIDTQVTPKSHDNDKTYCLPMMHQRINNIVGKGL